METYSVELTSELSRLVPVEVIALAGRADGSPPDVASLVRFAIACARRYVARKRPPDVLHIGDMASWPLALMAWTRRPRARIVLSAHGTDISYPRRKGWKGRLYGAYLRLGSTLLRRALVVANSATTAKAAAETGWASEAIVPLAARIPGERPPSTHGPDLLFVGRIVERKGCLWFVQNVLPLLPENIGLTVAGPLWNSAEGAALNDARVVYVGPLTGKALVDAYRDALCVVVPNINPPSGEFEGFGLVAAEAAAAGGLVLAAATDGLVEAVLDRETGLLVESGNAEAWATKILEISAWKEERRQEFIHRAMERARARYSWARVANDMLRLYDRTVSGAAQ